MMLAGGPGFNVAGIVPGSGAPSFAQFAKGGNRYS
jgi:fructose-1-phosphate kinase PfkB-like protein